MSRFTQLRAFTAFDARNFRLYFFGQCFALTGSWMQRVALTWLVMILTDSGEKMGLVEFLNQCPVFFVGLFIGVFLDRWDLRMVLIVTQIIVIIQSLILALLLYTDTVTYPAILFLSFVLGIIAAVDMPARQASISQMIDHPSQLQSALSLQSSSFNLARLLGPTVAGFVIRISGVMACFVLNALGHLAVLYAYIIMRLPERKRSARNLSAVGALREGLRYMWQVTPIRLCTVFNYAFCFVAIPYVVLMPLMVTRMMGGDERHYGFMLGGIGAGALAGALFIAFRISLRLMSRHICRMQILFGAALLVYSQVMDWRIAFAITPVLGFAITSSLVANNSLIQGLVDEDKRARVLSYYSFGLLGFGPLGAYLAGKLADVLDAQTALVICAALSLGVGLAHALRQKSYDAFVPKMLEDKGLLG
ncbi:MAG: MFS transporter [Deltaproteobacteria bacterium]|nr:MFS transporter [Deltaproteobacteria bacterium]